MAAAAAAGAGASLAEVAAETRRALAMKAAQIDADDSEPAPGTAPADAAVEAELLVGNEVGLHGRPAARFVETVGAFDAEVRVAKVGSGRPPVSARSLTNVVALGARLGDRVQVLASGPQAREAVGALQELAATGFGDGAQAPTPGTVLRGVAASAGVATGPSHRLRSSLIHAAARTSGTPTQELTLLERAIAAGATAERAIADAALQVAAIYGDLEDPLLAERAADVRDVARRIMIAIDGSLDGTLEMSAIDNESHSQILVADELAPSQTARLDQRTVAGIATAGGSATAHAAIIARALGIPAVVGLGDAILSVAEGTALLVDGGAGHVMVAPAADQVSAVEGHRKHERERAAFARRRSQEPAELASGERIEVFANIGGVEAAELQAARRLFDQACAETGVSDRPELGIMVEVPAAALTASELAPHVTFFSLGTNDLTQYTMAAERGNAELAPLLAEPQPAVLRLVQETVRAAGAHGRWVGACGEMAGDPAAATLLVGLGVTELSMSPRLIPEVKQALRGVRLSRARASAERALRATSAEAARAHGLELLGAGHSRASE